MLERLPGLIARLEARFRRRSTARTPPAASASPRRSISEFIDAGADAITGGNHAWDQREALVFIERAPRLIRPINYPARHARAAARR